MGVQEMEISNSNLKEQIEKLEIDNRKQQENVRDYLDVIKNKKKVEEELLETIRDIKDKVEKYEQEKQSIAKAEKTTVAGRLEDLNKEKHELNVKIKELSKLEVVKNELSTKNEELNTRIKDLTGKCKELETNGKKDREGAKTKEKSLNDQ